MTEYARREHRVAAIAAQVTLSGFRVDTGLLAARRAAVRVRKQVLLDRLQSEHRLPTTRKGGEPSANPQATEAGRLAIKRAFEDCGAPDMPITEHGLWGTSRADMDRMIECYPDRPEVVELDEMVAELSGVRTVYETVSNHLVGDRVHPRIRLRQASGRWSTTDPGLTVLGKRDGKHVERDIFLPEPGHVLISADLSGIDARVLAVLSQDADYLSMFALGRDVLREVAVQIWGDPSRREDAKAISHGWNYGRGLTAISESAHVPISVASEFDRGMRQRFPRLVEWREGVRALAKAGELLDNGFGRMMRPDPRRAHTQAPALMGQGCARDLLMEGLLGLTPEILPMLRLQVHDEVVLSVRQDQADDVERAVVEALSFQWAPPGCGRSVQIIAGVGRRGANWGAVYGR